MIQEVQVTTKTGHTGLKERDQEIKVIKQEFPEAGQEVGLTSGQEVVLEVTIGLKDCTTRN